VGDLKKLAAAQLGTKPEKLKIQKWHIVYKDHITLQDYEIHDGMGLELYVVVDVAVFSPFSMFVRVLWLHQQETKNTIQNGLYLPLLRHNAASLLVFFLSNVQVLSIRIKVYPRHLRRWIAYFDTLQALKYTNSTSQTVSRRREKRE
jgi:hypothetical protein